MTTISATATEIRRSLRPQLMPCCDLDDEAEQRYRNRKPKKVSKSLKEMTDDAKVSIFISMHNSKSVKDAREQWNLCKRIMSYSHKQKHDLVLTSAVALQYFSRNNSRFQQVQAGLTQVAVLVFLPFFVPPMLLVGVPALILLLPLILLVWVITAMNRRSNEVQERLRKSKKVESLGMSVRRRIRSSFVVPFEAKASVVEKVSDSTRTIDSNNIATSSPPIKQSPSSPAGTISNSPQPRKVKTQRRRSSFKRLFGAVPTTNIEECSQTGETSQTPSPVPRRRYSAKATSTHPIVCSDQQSCPTEMVTVKRIASSGSMRIPRTKNVARPQQQQQQQHRKSWIFNSPRTA